MEIIPDPVLSVVLFVPFLVTLLAMHFILWKPLRAYLDDRAQVVHKASEDAEAFTQKTNESVAVLEAELAAARQEAAEVRAAARARGQAREVEILDAAKAEAAGQVADAREQINKERAVAAAAVQTMADALAQDIAGQVLGRELGA